MAVGNPGSGRSRQNLENRSTMTRMQVLLSDDGRSVMKSTPRCDQGRLGMGNGTSLPEGRWRELLEMAQSGQPWTNLLTSLAMFGHQKRSLSSERVALAPGWPVPSEVCDEWMRGVRCVLGTYWWLGGQPGGLDGGVAETTGGEVHTMGLVMISAGKIPSGSSRVSSVAWIRDRASALTLRGPGR